MRSKEVEQYIDYLKTRLSLFHNNYQYATEQAIEGVLAYIEELEEENLGWKGKYHLLSRKIDVTPNSVIRDKIKELEEEIKLARKEKDLVIEMELEIQVQVLKELLGE